MTHTLVLGLALVATAPGLKDQRPEVPPLEGDWELVEWVQGGAAVRFQEGTGVEFRPGGQRLWRAGSGAADERGYKLHPRTNPPAIDLIRPTGGGPPDVYPAIYKVDGPTLVLCYVPPGHDRPTRFETEPGGRSVVMTFKRLPKK